jgi:hypothetical protein
MLRRRCQVFLGQLLQFVDQFRNNSLNNNQHHLLVFKRLKQDGNNSQYNQYNSNQYNSNPSNNSLCSNNQV